MKTDRSSSSSSSLSNCLTSARKKDHRRHSTRTLATTNPPRYYRFQCLGNHRFHRWPSSAQEPHRLLVDLRRENRSSGESLSARLLLMEFTRSICSRLIVVSWSLTRELGSGDSSSIAGGLRKSDSLPKDDHVPFNAPLLDVRFQLLLMTYFSSERIIARTFWTHEVPIFRAHWSSITYRVRSEVSSDWWYSVYRVVPSHPSTGPVNQDWQCPYLKLHSYGSIEYQVIRTYLRRFIADIIDMYIEFEFTGRYTLDRW